uniref:ORF-25 protein n=1 Tax=Lymantria dispar multicapsid nuclear polyhedrosis virus TaxID=10449 RepID=V9TKU3_NPVLD|nr:ORF-25 protein [Lymantria dispar multiple nucleopolyhedrovirus]QDH05874.1 ORF29 [Lymantria dispar multiple nucleopolyhedrovirus]QPD01822.1 hypothetical protein [Lymantria dispar multiple nucleopolyhedrovirus]QPD01996.1 hypothetical protein [Lymantria dispar multiple nucleopolyhedrovirus]
MTDPRARAINLLFAKTPRTLYAIAMTRAAASIDDCDFFGSAAPILEQVRRIALESHCSRALTPPMFQVEGMRNALYRLRLPPTAYVDMFFEKLPRCEVALREEGAVFTGFCEDCRRRHYTDFAHRDIELCYLYCPICANDLFCTSTDQ